jgi:DNA-binding GntR family transcriptional regulator
MKKAKAGAKSGLIRESIRRELRDHIVTGHLAPGTPLSPAELATKLGVSATPLREALIELVHDGMLENMANRGFVVARLSAQEVKDLYPMIWTLETLALKVRTPGSRLLAELASVNARFQEQSAAAELVELDARWHELLVSECANAVLISTLSSLRRRVYRYEHAYARYSSRMTQSAKQHAKIIRSLRAGKLNEAIVSLEENWRSGPEFLVPWLERTVAQPDLSRIADRLRSA